MTCFIKGTHNNPIRIDNNSAHGLTSQTQKGEKSRAPIAMGIAAAMTAPCTKTATS